jgi:hypothetical protein
MTTERIPTCNRAPTQKAGFRVTKTILWLIKHYLLNQGRSLQIVN